MNPRRGGDIIWVAVQALGGGTQKEGILSTYDKTGIAVIGY